MLETDIACCYFMGVVPSEIRHLTHAIDEQLGNPNPFIKTESVYSTCFAQYDGASVVQHTDRAGTRHLRACICRSQVNKSINKLLLKAAGRRCL